MFIQTATTPNPQTLKFLPGQTVLGEGTAQFNNEEEAGRSPLASELFKIEEVEAVFFGSDFISVTKKEDASWDLLKPHILTTVMDHFVAGKPVMAEDTKAESPKDSGENDSELVQQIKELIETRVRPAVAMDGGDIIFRGFDEKDGVVQLELHGACSGCPSSTITLKQGIENMLKHYVPEVSSVEAVEA